MKAFFDSPEAQEYASRVELIDEYYDAIVHAMEQFGVGDEAVPFWEVEDRVRDTLTTLDAEQFEIMMKSVVIHGQEYTSMHEVEQLRVMSHGEALKLHLASYLTRMAAEKAS